MSREIKFRGKRVDKDEWVYGYYVRAFEREYFSRSYDDVPPRCDYIDTDTRYYEVRPETTGQCTGLRDKNGVEIYEGDIFHLGDVNITYMVVWHDTGLIGKQIGSSSYAGLSYWRDKIEVIGNWFENPELLEGEK